MSEQVIKLSDNAANRIKEIMSKADNKTIGVRVGVKSGGCAGMSYMMEYAKEAKKNEEVIEDKGVKVFIDANAVMYLLGTEMDYKTDKFSSQFVFKNPNETERCGCGESFKVQLVMRDTKHLEKFARERLEKEKQKNLFKSKIRAVNTGANGTLEYTIKEGVNKGKIADEKILKNKD